MSKKLSVLVFMALLTAATIVVYLPALSNELVFDDRRLMDGTIFGQFGNILDLRVRMLSYSSFVWVQSLLGEEWWKQRLVNVVLHIGTAAGLFVLFDQLIRSKGFADPHQTDPEFLPSARAAVSVGVLLFALNPVAVYSVAYLIQRSIVMATLFVVLACVAWVRGLMTGRPVWLAAALGCYVLAVMSKEAAVTAAGLAVPLYLFVARPPWKRTVLLLGASLIVVLVVAAVLYARYGSILGVAFDESSRLYLRQLEVISPGISGRLYPLSILNQAALFFHYGFLWLVPNVQWLSIDLRPAFPLTFGAFPHWVGALGFLGLLAVASWLVLRRSGMLGFLGLCLLFPLVLFFTEFATVWVQDPFVLYRSYLWAIGIPGLVALPLIGFKPKVIYPLGVVLCLLFAGLAVERSLSLKNEMTVWSDAAEKIDLAAKPNAVGRWRPFINRGAYHLDREMADYAFDDFTRAEALGEPNGSARFNIGVSLQMMKKHPEALSSFAKAEAMGFTEPALYYQRGESLHTLGRFAEAFDSYSKSLGKPGDAKFVTHVRLRRAEAAMLARNYDIAISDFNQILKDEPTNDRAMIGLGMVFVGKEDSASALAVFNKSLAMRPTAAGYYGRGLAYVVAADKVRGLQDVDRAVALQPQNHLYKNMRAMIAGQK